MKFNINFFNLENILSKEILHLLNLLIYQLVI